MLDMKALAQATAEIVQEHVAKATAPLLLRIDQLEKRQPVAGQDGANGADGQNGADGKDCDMAAVLARVDEFLKAIPTPENGKDGKDGLPGNKGLDGRDGADGKDGIGLAGALIDRDGALVLTLSNGEARSLGLVMGSDGRDGEAGAAGRDGLQVKDIDLTLAADGRTLLLSLDDGEVAYTAEVGVPTMIYRGVFVEGSEYEKGDTVTWAGSLWHCNGETKDKPGEGSSLWTLAVKKGRDAKPVSVG